MYRIEDDLDAYRLDRAVATFGTALENALADAESKAKNPSQATRKKAMILQKWLGEVGFKSPPTKEKAAEVSSENSGPVSL